MGKSAGSSYGTQKADKERLGQKKNKKKRKKVQAKSWFGGSESGVYSANTYTKHHTADVAVQLVVHSCRRTVLLQTMPLLPVIGSCPRVSLDNAACSSLTGVSK